MSEPETDPRRYAQDAAVAASRFEVPVVPGDWDTGMLRVIADPGRLSELMPLRRGPVQGPGVQGLAVQEPLARVATTPRPQAASGARSSAAMATATIVSRLGGMVSQALQAAALGSSALATTLTIGLNLPNMLYILIIGGALNAVFVPQLVRSMHRDRDGGSAYASRLLTLVLTGVLVLTVLTELFTPQLVDLFSSFNGSNRQLASSFARMFMPQIFFLRRLRGVGQILDARGRFGPAAWAPVLNNLVVFAAPPGSSLVGGNRDGRRRQGRPDGSQTPMSAARPRHHPRHRRAGADPAPFLAVQRPILRRGSTGAGRPGQGRHAGQVDAGCTCWWPDGQLAVVMRLATGVDKTDPHSRSLAAYYKAQQVWILPQSLITVSLLTTLLPRMSRAAADDDRAAVRADLSLGLRVSGAAIVPCAVAFLALGPQFATVLFGYGKTDVSQAHGIGYMLAAFGLGLIPFSAQYVMLRGFYAFGDTRTPFTAGLITGAVNAAVAITATVTLGGTRWPVVVMAAGSGLSSAVGLAWSVRRLRSRLAGGAAAKPGRGVARVYRRLLLAATVAGVVGFAAAQDVGALAGTARPGSMLAAVAGGTALAVVYVLAAKALRVAEVDHLTRRVRARISGLIPRTG